MVTKKQNRTQGSSGGAAAAGGVGFQERVAALALTHALIGSDDLSSMALSGKLALRSVHLETAQVIDDVVLVGQEFRVLIQAKRNVSLSDSLTSEFSSAISQFVRHHFDGRKAGDRYVLATTLRSSERIIFELRKLTESVRLNARALKDDPLTMAEKDVLRKTRRLIAHHIGVVRHGAVTDDEVDQIFQSIWILPLDVETGGRDEALALALLKSRATIDPPLLWSALLELAANLAQCRSSVDLAGLQARLGHFIKPVGEKITIEDEFRFQMVQMDSVSAGKEVVVFDRFYDTDAISICEFYRFAKDGSRRLQFKGDKCTVLNGSTHTFLYRSSTVTGTTRYFDANRATVAGRKIVLLPYSGDEDFDMSAWSLAHQELLNGLMQAKQEIMRCLVCSDPISEDGALVAEIDEDEEPPGVGLLHRRCHRPSLRVLGEIQSKLFSEFQFLRNFDYELWILANRHGPSMISQAPLPDGLQYAAWNSEATGTSRGTWCVRINLEDGSASYSTERGKVVRLGQADAIEHATEFLRSFELARTARDPWCYSADRSLFSCYSQLVKRLSVGQRLLKCTGAEAVPFSRAIDSAYSGLRNHYSPLVVLLEEGSGHPVTLNNAAYLITDPFKLSTYLQNWADAGLLIPKYVVNVISDDREFDTLVSTCFGRGLQVVIDPLFDMQGRPLRGLVVTRIEEILGHTG